MSLWLQSCAPTRDPDELVIAIETAPITLDPRGAFNADTAHVQQLIFNTLVTKGSDFDLVPELASSWTVSADLTEHVFELRSGVLFHDGSALTTADVVFTFDLLAKGSFGKSPNFSALDRIEAIDARRVRFVSKRANPGLLVDMVAVGILRNGSGEEASTKPIGTGAFRVVDFDRDRDLRLEAFPQYFGGQPSVEALRIRYIADPTTRAASLETGEVDLAVGTYFSPETLARLNESGDRTRLIESEGGGIKFIALNVEAIPDPRTRRALALSIDRASIVDSLMAGRATLATGPLPPGHWARAEPPNVGYDVDEARSLREGAGRVAIDLLVMGSSRADVTLASVLQEAWRGIGVDVRIVEVEPAVFFERLKYGEFGAAIHTFTGGNQFTTIFKGAFHSRSVHHRGGTGGELNYARLSDPELDSLIDRADFSSDQLERTKLYAAAQQRIAVLQPWIFLWHPRNTAVVGARINDFELNRGGDFYSLRTSRLVKSN